MQTRTETRPEGKVVRAWGIATDTVDEAFSLIEDVLAAHGMNFRDNVVRTWFYCDHILDWYREFNAARTDWFNAHGVFDTFLPASTGIGLANPFGKRLYSGVIAADGAIGRRTVASPLQPPAMSYRSSFSRAAEMTAGDRRTLFVSGTAAILPGTTCVAYVGDPVRQIDCAMRSALAIVESRGLSATDVSRSICYFKRPEYIPLYFDWVAANLPGLPASSPLLDRSRFLIADVCRDEWLFEVELDAEGASR